MNPTETLQDLQKQLTQLKPAVTIFKEVDEVTRKCLTAAEEATKLLERLSRIYPKSLGDMEKKTVDDIERVADHAHQAIQSAETATSEHQKFVNDQITILVKQSEDAIENAKKLMDGHVADTKVQMVKLVQETEKIFQTELSRLKEVIEKEILAYRHLVDISEKLIEKINAIDFPQRLDKIDSNVSAINLGIQNVQNRLDNVEQNLKDEIKSTRGELANANNKIEQLSRKQDGKFQTVYILLIANALLIAGTLIYLLLR